MKFVPLATAALMAVSLVSSASADPQMTNDAKEIRAGKYILDKDHGKITWSLSHMGFSTYYGTFSDVAGQLSIDPSAPERTLLTVTVQTSGIATTNEKLDDELKGKDFFNASKFDTATFEATKIEVTGPNAARVTGNLTLLGVTKPEVLTVTFNQAGENPIDHKYRIGFTGLGTIKRSDFGMTKYVPLVGDAVTLNIEGEFVPAKGE